MPEKPNCPGLRESLQVNPSEQIAVILIIEGLTRLLPRHPRNLVDLRVLFEAGAVGEWPHCKPVDLFHPVRDAVSGGANGGNDPAVVPGFLQHLSDCGLLGTLSFVGLPFGERPVVVVGAMGEEDFEVAFGGLAEDDTTSGLDESCHRPQIRRWSRRHLGAGRSDQRH